MQPNDLSIASPPTLPDPPAVRTGFPAAAPPLPPPPPIWFPEQLGPLGEEPVTVTEPPQLFAGEQRYLSKRQIRQRRELQELIWPAVSRLLAEGEQILYLVPVVQIPPYLHRMGLGVWWPYYHMAAVVLTDRRLIEVELTRRGKRLGTRVRSWRWDETRELKLSFSRMWLRGAKRRRFGWVVRLRADRRLLKVLLANLREHLPERPETTSPSWHCPSCGHPATRHPRACERCGTRFRTRGLAAGLAMAFPGAGLLYAGHPFLAFFDLVGEVLLLTMAALMALQATSGAELAAGATGALLLFALTKVESVHLSAILVERVKPVAPERARRWKGFVGVGAALSVLAIATPLLFAGSLSPMVDRDLELADTDWQGSRTRAEWLVGQESAEKRSEWYGPHGELVAVMAYPLSSIETFDDFTLGFGSQLSATVETVKVGEFEAAHAVEYVTGAGGETFARIIYALYDPQGHDVHVVTLDSEEEGVGQALAGLGELVRGGNWVTAAARGR